MKQSPLSRVENLIRRVMEEPFTWFGSESLDPFQLALHLTRTYEGLERNEAALPTQFSLYISPEDYRELKDTLPGLEKQVADYVVLMTARNGIHLTDRPRIRFEIDPEQKTSSARIVAAQEDAHPQFDTAILAMESGDATQEAIREADAFLILQGRRHIPLDRPITRIGRRIENDIVLDAPSISRQHVQIRWRQRYFVLYDVSSHGRTSVNGVVVQEHILHPGDVIALSDILLVYGEGREDVLSVPDPSADEEMGSTLLKPDL